MKRPIITLALAVTMTLAPAACSSTPEAARTSTVTVTAGSTGGPEGTSGTSAETPETPFASQWNGDPVSLTFTGDVMLSRGVEPRLLKNGPAAAFGPLKKPLLDADISVVNLECPVGPKSAMVAPEPKSFTFMAPPVAADALVDADIDLVTLANNHAYDYGVPGIQSSVAALDNVGIPHVGIGMDDTQAHAPVILEHNGMKIGFLGYAGVMIEGGYDNHKWAAGPGKPGVAWREPERIAADVKALKPKVDHVIVLLHTGYEGTTKLQQEQVDSAYAARAAGATAVIGHHPHLLQGYDWDKSNGTLIAWSLGNTVFDPYIKPDGDWSALLDLELDAKGVKSVSWIPTKVDGYKGTKLLDPGTPGYQRVMNQVETAPKSMDQNPA